MEFTYKKLDNASLYEVAASPEFLNLQRPQNYVPIYTRFFSLNDRNCDRVTLNNHYSMNSITKMHNTNSCSATVVDPSGASREAEVFFKYSPLLDPTKYLMGRYDVSDNNLLGLPSFGEKSCHAKSQDPNNSAYVDSFFTYLSSQLLHTHQFPHSLDFYGSFLATKRDFQCNIADDVEYLNGSPFFHENRGILFDVDNTYANDMFNFDTRRNKNKLAIANDEDAVDILQLSDIADLDQLGTMFTNGSAVDASPALDAGLVFSFDITNEATRKSDSSSDCSSRSSVTDGDGDEEAESDDGGSGDDGRSHGSKSDSYSTASEDVLLATIREFPVQVIAMEKCSYTLDSLIVEQDGDITDKEWGSMMAQIVFTLLAYGKTFGFTHNDLHTNNIMYVHTDKTFLNYKFNNKHYKVPTFGKLYKIIDFGRAIYKFRGNVVCSDSYHPKGDAAAQYNFEPYFNPDKPRLEPNFSFDLCRLACSLYDFIIDDVEDAPKSPNTAARRMIVGWCMDDKGRNVLYKQNGEERYPDFKLYKMISRTVHNHTPEAVIESGYFERFVVPKKKINRSAKVINIDSLPSYQ